MSNALTYCPTCATPLQLLSQQEDGGPKARLRCPACGWTHWNNPTPVLAAVIELADRDGQLLLARNAAWPGKAFGLITGFMEAGESPQEGITREVAEETSLTVDSLSLIGVYDFQRMNQVIIAYHALARGEIALSPELAEYRLFTPDTVRCWRAGTGYALADWLSARGHTPKWVENPAPAGQLGRPRIPVTQGNVNGRPERARYPRFELPAADPESQEGAGRNEQR